VIGFEIFDQRAQVVRDRPELRWWPRKAAHATAAPARNRNQVLTAQQPAQPRDPAAPRQLRDDDGDQRDGEPESDEEEKEVLARLVAAARDEAHVVDEHELADA